MTLSLSLSLSLSCCLLLFLITLSPSCSSLASQAAFYKLQLDCPDVPIGKSPKVINTSMATTVATRGPDDPLGDYYLVDSEASCKYCHERIPALDEK